MSAAYQNKTVLASVPVEQEDGTIVHTYNKPSATVHAIVGTGGAGFSKNDCATVGGTCPEWSELVAYAHGYARFVAVNSTALSWEYVDSVQYVVVDRVMLVQDLAAWEGPVITPGLRGSAWA